MILTNAFSINMLPEVEERIIKFLPLTAEQAAALVREAVDFNDLLGAIGHQDTAVIVNGLLGIEIAHSRATVKFSPHDTLVVAQYSGPRLPEAATTLPDGAVMNFWLVEDANA